MARSKIKPEGTNSAPVGQTSQDVSASINGRAVFVVETTPAGIVVRTAFLATDGKMIELPAIFPNLSYALSQIDHLRHLVIDRFEQAAQVGVQVIAANTPTQNVGQPAEGAIPPSA